MDEFIRLSREVMEPTDDPALAAYRAQYDRFVEPGEGVTHSRNRGAAPNDEATATWRRSWRGCRRCPPIT